MITRDQLTCKTYLLNCNNDRTIQHLGHLQTLYPPRKRYEHRLRKRLVLVRTSHYIVTIVLSQLSKKFPISDVLERQAIQDLDDELAEKIIARIKPSKSAFMMQKYFSGDGSGSPLKNASTDPLDGLQGDSFSRNPDTQSHIYGIAPNAKIFGKLKFRETRIPSTALERHKNVKSIIQQKKKANTMQPYPFVSPQKMKFFKSHYNYEGSPDKASFINCVEGKSEGVKKASGFDMSDYTGREGQAYYQPSFNGINHTQQMDVRSSFTEDKFRPKSNSALRNCGWIQQSQIQELADRRRRNNNKTEVTDFIFRDDESQRIEEDGVLNYGHDSNEAYQSVSINLPQNKQKLQNYKNQRQSQGEILRPSNDIIDKHILRVKSQAQSRRKRVNVAAVRTIRDGTPSLMQLVKMPKRLLVKTEDQKSVGNYSLYNCCPQAAFVDKQLEENMSPVLFRQNLMSCSRGTVRTRVIPSQTEGCKSPGSKSAKNRGRRNTTENRFTSDGNQSGLNKKQLILDPQKVREARDLILKLSKIRIESQFNPYPYEYIHVNKALS